MNDELQDWLDAGREALSLLAKGIFAGAIAAVLLLALFGPSLAHAQATVPAEVKPAQKGERCFPGLFGTVWPGVRNDFGTRTDNGWFAYVWCKAPDGGARYIVRVCVHGECAPQNTYWNIGGTLVTQQASNGMTRDDTVEEWMKANPLAYICPIYPSGAQPPGPRPADQVQFPAVGTKRADICMDVLIAMRADWPQVAAPPPPPPPPQTGWTAYGGTIFKHAAGKLTGVVSGKTAAKGAACTGVTVATAGTFVYQPLTGGPADEATRCVKP